MAREKFSNRELEAVGTYPAVPSSAFPMPPEPRYDRPISPKENLKLFFGGKTPYWIPKVGFGGGDLKGFRPRLHPDNVVTHIITDGEPPMQFPENIMRSSWFELDWEFVPSANGATVHPGNPKVPDISRWEDYVSIPDLDSLDWDSCARNNADFMDTDKAVELGILTGFWERLVALCDVDKAAMALIDEDDKEGVHRLFDKIADMHIGYITRMKEICDIDGVLIHDDWGHQNAPFFSLETAQEMLVPYLKRVVGHCHSLGLFYEQHSCGKCEILVPAYVEAGVDVWCGQPMNDFDRLSEEYISEHIAFGMPGPVIAEGTPDEQIREIAKDWVEKYKDRRVVLTQFGLSPIFTDAVYEYSRKAYEEAEA
ncbi:MAG: hypothetical protein FWG30_03350 [Eubacteriaceae bacterium]|nr:hypothetical protein [Eubacteriaceae bacterium]